MRHIYWLALLILFPLLTGCARFPSTPLDTDVPPETIYASMTVNGRISINRYYILAFGVDQTRNSGPVPVVVGPQLGNGFVVIAPTPAGQTPQQPPFVVRYSIADPQITQWRLRTDGTYESLGSPFRAGFTDDFSTLYVEIDERLLEPLLPASGARYVQMNWVTLESYTTQPQNPGEIKQFDGFGPDGSAYQNIPIDFTNTTFSGDAAHGVPEEMPNDNTTNIADIDLIGWRIEVKIR